MDPAATEMTAKADILHGRLRRFKNEYRSLTDLPAAALPLNGVCARRPSHASSAPGEIKVPAESAFANAPSPEVRRVTWMSEGVCRSGSAWNLSGPTHGDGERAGEIRLGPLSQERLALHHVVHGL